jgi:threonine dehydrogenase-like Zn-dependent dehydrogenase
METAVNFAQDGAPLTGERVAVVGQGIVGLLTTALLSRFPLEQLVTFDRYLLRRQASLSLGASASLDPAEAVPWSRGEVDLLEAATTYGEFDLVYELSGDPSALDLAISLCGFGGRVVIGSWYGEKMAPVDLGGKFHRSRIQLIGSQVSTIAPSLSGRWDKPRRLGVAWEMLRKVKPASLITQTFPFEQAAEAYRLIDEHPEETVQVVLTY